MINATRLIKTLDEKGCLQLNLPEFSAQQVEIVILPIKQDDTAEAMQLAVLQSQSGFAQTVLADAAEDVWNDL